MYSLKPPKSPSSQAKTGKGVTDEDHPLTSPQSEGCNGASHNNGEVTSSDSRIPLNGKNVEAAPQSENVVPRVYKRRWIMLMLFTSYSFTNAYQWIHLNIIGNVVMKYYNSSLPESPYHQQLTIDWLSMIYMLAYVPLILPVTWLLDKRGLRIVGIAATFLNALGAWLKCGSVGPERFALVMVAQTICAIGQVFILGMPARLAAVWFGHNQVSTIICQDPLID